MTDRLWGTTHDLYVEPPRPVLGARTAREVYEDDLAPLVDRQAFVRDLGLTEDELRRTANSL
jgi:hypothetical protein